MSARFRIVGEASSAVAAAHAVRDAISQTVAASRAATAESREASRVATQAAKIAADAERTLAATTVEGGRAVVEQQSKKLAMLREESALAQKVAASYKKGSDEQAIAIKRVNTLLAEQEALLGRNAELSAGGGAAKGRGRGAAERGLLSGSGLFRGRGMMFASNAFLGGAIGGFEIKKAVDAVKEQEVSLGQLALAVKNTGNSWSAYRGQIQRTIEAGEKLGFTGNDQRTVLAGLVRSTGSVTKAQEELAAAYDLARARHMSLSAAGQILNRLNVGQATSLRRLGIPVQQVTKYEDELKNAHIRVTSANRAMVTQLQHEARAKDIAATRTNALRLITERYGGSAERYNKTAAGATDQLRVAFEHLQIQIGRAVLPTITLIATELTKLIHAMEGTSTRAKVLRVVVLGAIGGLLALVSLPTAIVVATVAATVEIVNHWKRVRDFFKALWITLKVGFDNLWDELKISALAAYAAILEPFSHLPFGMGKWAQKAKDNVNVEIAKLKSDMAQHGVEVSDAWGQAFDKGMSAAARTAMQHVNKIVAQGIAQGQVVTEHGAGQAGSGHATGVGVSSGRPETSYANRVSGPTAGLSALQSDLPGPKGDPAIGFKGHAKTSYHYSGEALDIGDGGNPNALISDWNFLYPNKRAFAQLFWDPPASTQRRAKYPTGFYYWGDPGDGTDHHDHIHVAFTGTPAELKRILEGHHGGDAKPPKPPRDTTPTDTQLTSAEARAKALGKKTSNKKSTAEKAAARYKPMFGQTLINYIATRSINLGLDPDAVLAVASVEGGFNGHVGDHGTSFGPFQLHIGGALPSSIADQGPIYAAAWANSAEGVDYALRLIAKVAGGQKGATAVHSIVASFEKPTHIGPEVAKATGRLGQTRYRYDPRAGQGAVPPGGASQATVTSIRQSINQMITAANKALADARQKIRDALDQLGPDFIGAANLTISDELQSTINNAESHLRKLRAHLKAGLSASDLAATRANIKKWGKVLSDAISEAGKEATAAADAAARARSRATRDFVNTAQREFDRQTQAFERAFNRETQKYVDSFNKTTQAALKNMQVVVHGPGISPFTFGGAVTQTPAEKQLADLQEQQTRRDLRQQLADAQLAMQQALAGGDPKAIAAAQKQLDDARLAQREHDLEAQAQVERSAADDQLQAAKDAYEEQRNQQLEAYQQSREDALTSYQTQRQDQWQHFTDLLDDQQAFLDAGVVNWAKFVHNLQAGLAAVGVEIGDAVVDQVIKSYGGDVAGHTRDAILPDGTHVRIHADGAVEVVGGKIKPAQAGMYVTRPTLIQTGEHEHEAILPWSWLPEGLRKPVAAIMRAHRAPGSERIKGAAGGRFVPDDVYHPFVPQAAPAPAPVFTPPSQVLAAISASGGSRTATDPVRAATAAAQGAAQAAVSAAAAARAAGPAPAPVVQHVLNVDVQVAGSVAKERDLALSIRDVLVHEGRLNGGNVFAGYA